MVKAFVYGKNIGGADRNMRFEKNHPVVNVSDSIGKVQVKVHTASLNPIDYKLPKFPFVMWFLGGRPVCHDFAGVVTQVGKNETEYKIGDRVFGFASTGSLAEYALAPTNRIGRIPDSVSFDEAASLVVAGVTSFEALVEYGKMGISNLSAEDQAILGKKYCDVIDKSSGVSCEKKKEHILIIGGSGGCGLFGLQIAKILGAEKVSTVCSAKNADLVRKNGADEVLDYTDPNFVLPNEKCPEGSLDVVYDCVSSPEDFDYTKSAFKCIKSRDAGGMYVAINTARGMIGWISSVILRLPGFSFFKNHQYELMFCRGSSGKLSLLAKWVAEKKLEVPIEKTFPFSEQGCEEAFQLVKGRRAKGKVLVKVVGENL